jgi:hypothetical protein
MALQAAAGFQCVATNVADVVSDLVVHILLVFAYHRLGEESLEANVAGMVFHPFMHLLHVAVNRPCGQKEYAEKKGRERKDERKKTEREIKIGRKEGRRERKKERKLGMRNIRICSDIRVGVGCCLKSSGF